MFPQTECILQVMFLVISIIFISFICNQWMIKSKTNLVLIMIVVHQSFCSTTYPCRNPRVTQTDFWALTQGTNNRCPMLDLTAYNILVTPVSTLRDQTEPFWPTAVVNRFTPVVVLHIDWCISNGVDFCRIEQCTFNWIC